jgi:hypothetical protein
LRAIRLAVVLVLTLLAAAQPAYRVADLATEGQPAASSNPSRAWRIELWSSDGTSGGTHLVQDIVPGGPDGSCGCCRNRCLGGAPGVETSRRSDEC